jgi:hypothetical protein
MRDSAPARREAPLEQGGPVESARAFYFGHSLVDQDMPRMVESMARARGQRFEAYGQLGWGTSLAAHAGWNGQWAGAPLGFEDENKGRSFFRGEGKSQLDTAQYDTLVLTETNGYTSEDPAPTIREAVKLVSRARKANPQIRVFLYANWLNRNAVGGDHGWLTRTDKDLPWWEGVADAVGREVGGPPVYVLPGGKVLAEVVRAIMGGKLPGVQVNDLFRKDPKEPGGIDGVHVNDLGFYVIALAHYTTIFRSSPIGLPVQTDTEDGPAEAFAEPVARKIQQIVHDTLRAYPRAGTAAITLPETSAQGEAGMPPDAAP